jgi:PIN like domain
MRDKFPGYYTPLDVDFVKMWEKGLFIFDANALLDLYRYSEESIGELIKVIETVRDRIWIPFQVSKEYHRNLNTVISGQVKKYNDSIETLKHFKEQIDERRNHPFLNEKLNEEISQFCSKLNDELEKKKSTIKELIINNPIKEKLADLLKDKVGDPFLDDELNVIYQSAEKRILARIPPGYMDKSKPAPDKYGDYVIWYDILKKNKEIDQPIILITRDTKEDWYYEELGLTVGPRPELIDEFCKTKNNLFYCYTTDQFLKYAKKHLNIDVTEKAITEIGEYISQTRIDKANESISEENITEQVSVIVSSDVTGSISPTSSSIQDETSQQP